MNQTLFHFLFSAVVSVLGSVSYVFHFSGFLCLVVFPVLYISIMMSFLCTTRMVGGAWLYILPQPLQERPGPPVRWLWIYFDVWNPRGRVSYFMCLCMEMWSRAGGADSRRISCFLLWERLAGSSMFTSCQWVAGTFVTPCWAVEGQEWAGKPPTPEASKAMQSRSRSVSHISAPLVGHWVWEERAEKVPSAWCSLVTRRAAGTEQNVWFVPLACPEEAMSVGVVFPWGYLWEQAGPSKSGQVGLGLLLLLWPEACSMRQPGLYNRSSHYAESLKW